MNDKKTAEPKCICYTPEDLDPARFGNAAVPARPLNICPVHRPRLHAMRLRNAEARRG